MENKEFSEELERRTLAFAVSIIKLSKELSNEPEEKVIRYQITKSGTSMGANYREANRARSRRDFINKISICETESSETKYWLKVIGKSELLPWKRIKHEYEECCELLAIFTSIGKSSRGIHEPPPQITYNPDPKF